MSHQFTKMRITYPSVGLLRGQKYVPAAQTNIQDTWRRFGWVPVKDKK